MNFKGRKWKIKRFFMKCGTAESGDVCSRCWVVSDGVVHSKWFDAARFWKQTRGAEWKSCVPCLFYDCIRWNGWTASWKLSENRNRIQAFGQLTTRCPWEKSCGRRKTFSYFGEYILNNRVCCDIIMSRSLTMERLFMPVSYDKLWKLLIDRKMTRTDLK